MNPTGVSPGPSSARRVVITGIGVVSPLGIGVQKNWEALLRGQGGIGLITRFDASKHSTRIAGEVKNFDPLAFIDRKEARKMDLFIQLALAAAALAVEDAAIEPALLEGDRTGVYIGSGIGGVGPVQGGPQKLVGGGPGRGRPFFPRSVSTKQP